MRKRERKKQTISRKQLFIEEKISSLRRPDLQGGEKTSTISLRRTREFFIAISYIKNCTKSNSLSANKYPGSAADSTRRRSGNLRARKLLLVLSLRLPSPLRFFFFFLLLRHPLTAALPSPTRFIPADRPFRPFSASRAVESFAFSTITLRSTRIIL